MFGLTYSCANTCNAADLPQSSIDSLNVLAADAHQDLSVIKAAYSDSYVAILYYDEGINRYCIVVASRATGKKVIFEEYSSRYLAFYEYDDILKDFNID